MSPPQNSHIPLVSVVSHRPLEPSPKRRKYPTSITEREVTTERVREWNRLKRLDTTRPELSDVKRLAQDCKEILGTSPDAKVREKAPRVIDEMVESYRNYPRRDDGTAAVAHPLAITYLGLMAGAEADLGFAMPNHDRPEDGKLLSFADWTGKLGFSSDPNGLLASAWWYMQGASHLPLLDDSGQDVSDLVKSRLRTPAGFRDPVVKRYLDIMQQDYENYAFKQIFQSGSVPLIQLKALDTMHNAKSLHLLDPQKNFWRMYKTIWAAMIKLDVDKRICFLMADEIKRGIEGGLERMQEAGIGRYELRRNWSHFLAHRDHKSPIQLQMERNMQAITGPRAALSPREQPYGATEVITCFFPDNWMDAVGTDVKKPMPLDFEIPRYPRNSTGTRELQESAVRAAIKRHLPASMFTIKPTPSLQLALLGHTVIIHRIGLDARLPALVDELQHLDVREAKKADSLLEQGYAIYHSFRRDLSERLKAVARDVFRPESSQPADLE